MERVKIDGIWFDRKVDGMTLVDSYYIPDEEVDQYVKDREHYAAKATAFFEKEGWIVSRDFKGSQDGEAIVGRDKEGEIQRFVHLDPMDVEGMKEADAKGFFEKYFDYEEEEDAQE